MSYFLHLHRSFDIQLSPVAASIIDWAPTHRGSRFCSDVSSDFASSADCNSSVVGTTSTTTTTGSGSGSGVVDNCRQLSRNEREGGDGVRRRAPLPSSVSQHSVDGSMGRFSETVGNRSRKGTCVDLALSDRRGGTLTEKGSHIIPRFHISQRQVLVNSYASMPLVSRESIHVNAGLFAALGMTNDVFSSSATSSIWRPLFDANEVFQLECICSRMQWAVVVNAVFFSWRTSTLPLCEIIGITPTTDWSIQADKLLINWSGFWRLYVRGNRSRSNSLLSMNSPAERCTPSENIEKVENNSSRGSVRDVTTSIDTTSTTTTTTTTTSTVSIGVSSGSSSTVVSAVEGVRKDEQHRGTDSNRDHNDFSRGNNDNNNSNNNNKNLVKNPTVVDITSTGDSAKLSEKGGNTTDIAFNYRVNEGKATSSTDCINTSKWWYLEELRCGAGFAVKNDLASGVNVYFGCSGHFGRALTFSTHVDALRRACCSVTTTTASLELAARLRMNLITWHRTELDAGVGWRPLKHVPGITCRLSHSMGRLSIGVSVKDLAAQYRTFMRWKEGWWWQQQQGAGEEKLGDKSIVHKGVDLKKNVSAAAPATTKATTTTIKTPLAGEDASWYSSYVGWLNWVSTPFGGGAAVSAAPVTTASTADPTRNISVDRLGFRERLSQAVRMGFHYADDLLCQTELDLTMGVAADRPQSRALRLFVSLSAH
ncbi:uncharacterized protein TM35_000101470 [Trypanosoma theileri]|uniref:Uncharacterized protein n=1 Tax=Trypanosoma theileri TaxID=67003 RepID=A0A1X0P071_9TRYP|nr:uncharacterized protein TM35_000101470 [Trypanosoma theileri]ORC89879.1 hypothetical protein TM35_000101470 [Trypanosoma theileri]